MVQRIFWEILYSGSRRNGRERERTAGKQSDISLKSSVSLYKVIGYAEVKCSVLSLNKITPNLAASADSFNLPVCFFLSLYPITPLPLVLLEITSNMTEIQVSIQRAQGLRLIETEGKSFTWVNVLICSKTVITCDMDEAFLPACVRLVSVCCQCSHKEPFGL